MDCDTIMEEQETENGSENARSESDAAATRKEAANKAVAAMSKRVSGNGKRGGMVAGYARPGADQLHKLRDVTELRDKSAEAVMQRPCNKVGGLLGMYQQRVPAVVMKGMEGEKPADAQPVSIVRGFTTASARTRTMRTTPWHSSAEAPSSVLVPATAPRVRARATPSSHLAFVTRRLPLSIYAPPVLYVLYVQLYDLST